MEKEFQLLAISEDLVASKIHLIQGKRYMLDRILSDLYEVETRVINQAVNRNIERFPEVFKFQLISPEFEILKSQIVTSNWSGTRKLLHAFTEQGVACRSPNYYD
jgi:hypothetical protein